MNATPRRDVSPDRAVLSPRRTAVSLLLPLLTLAASVAAAHATLSGAPVLGQQVDTFALATGTAGCVLFAVAASRLWRRAAPLSRRVSALLPVLAAASLVFGVANQVVIDGHVYWRGSTQAHAYATAMALRGDLSLLVENEALLQLSPDQGRGLADAYRQAMVQADAVARRWNPAAASRPPLPGMVDVYVQTNRAAAAQVQAMRLYLDNLEVPDSARAAEISRLAVLSTDSANSAAVLLGAVLQDADIRLPGSGS